MFLFVFAFKAHEAEQRGQSFRVRSFAVHFFFSFHLLLYYTHFVSSAVYCRIVERAKLILKRVRKMVTQRQRREE